jgi:hypothetical protein
MPSYTNPSCKSRICGVGSACRSDQQATADTMMLANPHPPIGGHRAHSIGGPTNHPGQSFDRPLYRTSHHETMVEPNQLRSYPHVHRST